MTGLLSVVEFVAVIVNVVADAAAVVVATTYMFLRVIPAGTCTVVHFVKNKDKIEIFSQQSKIIFYDKRYFRLIFNHNI